MRGKASDIVWLLLLRLLRVRGEVREVREVRDEVQVRAVLDEVVVARGVEGQDGGPDGHERPAQLGRWRLQEFEHVRENAHAERQIHRARPELEEAAQQQQRAHAVRLRQQDLQHHGQLLRRRRARRQRAARRAEPKPHFERAQLLLEEPTAREGRARARKRYIHFVWCFSQKEEVPFEKTQVYALFFVKTKGEL